jgi:hypothetical protein
VSVLLHGVTVTSVMRRFDHRAKAEDPQADSVDRA